MAQRRYTEITNNSLRGVKVDEHGMLDLPSATESMDLGHCAACGYNGFNLAWYGHLILFQCQHCGRLEKL